MNSDKEVVALLREIRDLLQICVVRDQLTSLLQQSPPTRNSRSWSLSAHRVDRTETDTDPGMEA